jgi:hypothetical protein
VFERKPGFGVRERQKVADLNIAFQLTPLGFGDLASVIPLGQESHSCHLIGRKPQIQHEPRHLSRPRRLIGRDDGGENLYFRNRLCVGRWLFVRGQLSVVRDEG